MPRFPPEARNPDWGDVLPQPPAPTRPGTTGRGDLIGPARAPRRRSSVGPYPVARPPGIVYPTLGERVGLRAKDPRTPAPIQARLHKHAGKQLSHPIPHFRHARTNHSTESSRLRGPPLARAAHPRRNRRLRIRTMDTARLPGTPRPSHLARRRGAPALGRLPPERQLPRAPSPRLSRSNTAGTPILGHRCRRTRLPVRCACGSRRT